MDRLQVTEEQQERDLKIIAGIKDKNEKLAWTRRQKKMEAVITEELNPLEEQIMALQAKRMEILEAIQILSKQMRKECVHPRDMLVHKITYVECKFCNTKLSLPKVKK